MQRIGKRTRLLPSEVLSKAASYFGDEGIGLTVSERSPQRVVLTGGGGFVEVSAHRNGEELRSEVDVVAREWESSARDFIAKL